MQYTYGYEEQVLPKWERKEDIVAVRYDVKDTSFRRLALLLSDLHIDSMNCDRDLMHTILAKAAKLGCPILIFGDLFCAMQTRNDRRGSKSAVLPELNGSDYLDRLVDFAHEQLEPYAKNIVFVGDGNHETSVKRHNETNILARLVRQMNAESSADIMYGGYRGFIRYYFNISKTQRASHTMAYHHGHGGAAKRSKGVLDFDIAQSAYHADSYIYGHLHTAITGRLIRQEVTQGGRIVNRVIRHIRLPSMQGESQWSIEKGMTPLCMGGSFVEFYLGRNGTVEIKPIDTDT